MCSKRNNEIRWKCPFQISPETTAIQADFTWFFSVPTSRFLATNSIRLRSYQILSDSSVSNLPAIHTVRYDSIFYLLPFNSIVVKQSKLLINFYEYSLIILKNEIQLPFYGIRFPCGGRNEIGYGNVSVIRPSSWTRMVYPPDQGDGQGKLIGWKCGEL